MKKLLLLSLMTFLVGCSTNVTKKEEVQNKPLTVSIIHINDHHSYLEPNTVSAKINGRSVKLHIGGMSEVVNQINDFRKTSKNPIVLHAGDAMTGTLYFTLFKGSSDAAIMNLINFDAFTLGNHEFDAQNEGLKYFLDQLKVPVISANVVPDKGSILENKWKPYIIKEIEGQKVGIIGLDVAGKTQLSSSPGKDIKFLDEIQTADKYVKVLQKLGINKIILLSHAGTGKNLEIAEKVPGVDVIISGDWHTLFGDGNLKGLGLPVSYEYPTKVVGPTGEPAYVVEGWEYGKFVGNLKVNFDEKGIITDVENNSKVLVKDDFFELKDAKGNKYQAQGEEKQELINTLAKNKNIAFGIEDEKANAVIDKFKAEKEQLAKQKVGSLVGPNMPGGSQNRIPGRPGAHPEGSIATRFVAETMLSEMRNMGDGNIDFTVQNSGGVRKDIVSGELSFNDIYGYLPFGNTLFLLKLNGAEVKQMLEEAIDFAVSGGSTGSFPYGAGIRYEAIEDAPMGQRVLKVEIQDQKTNAWLPLDFNKEYMMGTNAYIAAGRDGYIILGKISSDPNRFHMDTFLPDAESFIKFLKLNKDYKTLDSSNVKFTPKK